MSRDEAQGFQQEVGRVEDLIAALDGLRDSAAREPARELVQVVLELHGGGLGRLLELVAATEGGPVLIERLAQDDRVSGLLLLHGLHPQDLETRVSKAIEKLHPHLGVEGARIEDVSIAGAAVRLRVRPGANTAQASAQALKRSIEDAIIEAAPDVEELHIDGLDAAVALVSVASIKRQSIAQPLDAADNGS